MSLVPEALLVAQDVEQDTFASSVLRDPARAGGAQRRNARHERRARRPSCTRSCGSAIRSSSTPAQLKVALNSEFSDWQTPLKHGDTVVFIPPVAGG